MTSPLSVGADGHTSENGFVPRYVHPKNSKRLVTMEQDQGIVPVEVLIGMILVVYTNESAGLEQDRATNGVIRLPLIRSDWNSEYVLVAHRLRPLAHL